jgi:hypothetical protein
MMHPATHPSTHPPTHPSSWKTPSLYSSYALLLPPLYPAAPSRCPCPLLPQTKDRLLGLLLVYLFTLLVLGAATSLAHLPPKATKTVRGPRHRQLAR